MDNTETIEEKRKDAAESSKISSPEPIKLGSPESIDTILHELSNLTSCEDKTFNKGIEAMGLVYGMAKLLDFINLLIEVMPLDKKGPIDYMYIENNLTHIAITAINLISHMRKETRKNFSSIRFD